jgi:glutamate-1-semialdehyde 2,1-aminomutase
MRAGIETLDLLEQPGAYERLEQRSAALQRVLTEAAHDAGVPATINRVGSMMTLFFNEGPVTDFVSASVSDVKKFAVYFHSMLSAGVYLPPSQFEALFVSLEHGDAEIHATEQAARDAMRQLST